LLSIIGSPPFSLGQLGDLISALNLVIALTASQCYTIIHNAMVITRGKPCDLVVSCFPPSLTPSTSMFLSLDELMLSLPPFPFFFVIPRGVPQYCLGTVTDVMMMVCSTKAAATAIPFLICVLGKSGMAGCWRSVTSQLLHQ